MSVNPAETTKKIKRDIIAFRTLEIAMALGVALIGLASTKNFLYLIPAFTFFVSGYIAQINVGRKKSRLSI